jgi:broad specificity phosphatase PhoE
MQPCVFYLIRHAHADWTPDEERPLSAQGMEDAIRVADALCRMPVAQIYSSPYRRAIQTVQPLADRLDLAIEIASELRERSLGNPKPGTDFVGAVEKTWVNPSFAHPGGESNKAAQMRTATFVRRLLADCEGGHIALSTHGNLLALLAQLFEPRIGFGFWKALSMPDIYTIRLDGSEVSLDRLWRGQDGANEIRDHGNY